MIDRTGGGHARGLPGRSADRARGAAFDWTAEGRAVLAAASSHQTAVSMVLAP